RPLVVVVAAWSKAARVRRVTQCERRGGDRPEGPGGRGGGEDHRLLADVVRQPSSREVQVNRPRSEQRERQRLVRPIDGRPPRSEPTSVTPADRNTRATPASRSTGDHERGIAAKPAAGPAAGRQIALVATPQEAATSLDRTP